MRTPHIHIASTEQEILACFPVLRQLRTHLVESELVDRVRAQERERYHLLALEAEGAVRAVAGFRLMTNLVSGRILYVDDLVTDDAVRSQGYGRALLDWLVAHARAQGCQCLELDSGVQRFAAHRFYLTNRMIISSHHFRLTL